MEPLDARLELEEVVEQLGGVENEFRPHAGNLIAGMVIGPIAVVAGALILAFLLVQRPVFDDKGMAILGFGALLLFSGTTAFIVSFRRRSYRVLLCQGGIVEAYASTTRACPWDKIEKVEESESVLPQAQLTSQRKIFFVHWPGVRLKFDLQSVSDVEQMMRLIKRKAEQHAIPWIKGSHLTGRD
jgi:hypothetical protein